MVFAESGGGNPRAEGASSKQVFFGVPRGSLSWLDLRDGVFVEDSGGNPGAGDPNSKSTF